MKLHLPFPRHTRTRYVQFNLHACKACWSCVDACPQHVLGKIDYRAHHHAHVDNAALCRGCRACVRACPYGAITQIKFNPQA